ncbi:tetratricopeptide repeat-containing sulfotransferase family protein [Maricaulis sp.]|uniref:tetratricopeptide repeat-containing sulfotransferase family protein n=1 Tax=Maricaulis sp. TaxID=1486257 RepID=UPI002B2745C7|nr:sulfotransferase [Maricaulis sp.]
MNTSAPPQAQLASIDRALRAGRIAQGQAMSEALVREYPGFAEGWIIRARALQKAGDAGGMRAALNTALSIEPSSPLARLMMVEADVHLGDIKQARAGLLAMEDEAAGNANWLGRLAEAFAQCGQHADAARCARAAVALSPDEPAHRYNLATHLVAVGELEAAEAAFDDVIARAPHDYDAYYNRATLRRQTADRNHVDELQRMVRAPHRSPMGPVALHYALAKELEDLGDYKASFDALTVGAGHRRGLMRYDVSGDVDTMAQIASAFDRTYFDRVGRRGDGIGKACKGEGEVEGGDGPVFVLGLPRSGTTLIDRILSAHSEVESLGELNDFALGLTTLCRADGGKSGLIKAASGLDPSMLGQAYCKRAGERAAGSRFFIDKAPANFLYIGLIAAALPAARIIHLQRDPMDNAYSLYKALFRMGYPYSYDFADLAAYMRAKDALMAHWRDVLPGRIIDVQYEDVVTDQDGQTRRLLEAVGLEFEQACLAFHRNPTPSATHSAAQVRQPLYSSSVGLWHRYEAQLQPLAAMLGVTP